MAQSQRTTPRTTGVTDLRHRLQDARDQVRLLGRASESAREAGDPDELKIGREFMAAIRLRDKLAADLVKAVTRA